MTGESPGDRHAPDPRVRAARPADANQIRGLQGHLRQPNPDLLEYGLAVGSALVSVADGRAVGYLLPVDAPNRPGVHLAELAVAPDYRRKGRARGLLSAVLADATGPVTLQAHPDNDAALSLYEELGFEVVDRRADAYADGDALVLRRE
ncbi:GNAT family N-acetyltransferase [Halorubrum lacusprofundi]|jgi:ribosomal protein S18 acetylase RimI-like enzyme|uniref:GCN5-related N-acetyltransferase n=1 Tax=Halorubrum lacusprofundi (strain ATCC 49239 / DSM 5036 / JCM 8891 / ACAM 34) TaxID=416348 RepID=B9LRA7_HALLT|nr:GNAT family N-acetyltransferase [Halorubrum lacusprofundi]ACM57761.1 GCN5-related N-acetyltransferase [Halorubrum lacusprofundi ATCC 49239]MCG1007083.1 GNAT family N-acetyltransferase [Halorubrum lacusprofundi]